jgi:hypothetical protein
MEAIHQDMIHELLWGERGQIQSERQNADSVNPEFGKKLATLIHRGEQAWMSARTDDLTGMRVEGDDDGGSVQGPGILDRAVDDRAMTSMDTIEDSDAHHRTGLIVRYLGQTIPTLHSHTLPLLRAKC